MTQPITDEDRKALKDAAYGAILLVSNADPGFLDMFKESFAASKALAGSSGVVREALTKGGIPSLPKSSPADLEAMVLPGLRRSMEILRAKAPDEAEPYRSTVLAACEQAAEAGKGIQETETTIVDKIRAALGA
jgi:hypothetical protein